MYQKSITKDEMKLLQRGSFMGEVMIMDRNSEVPSNVVKELQGCPVLGFDTETRPSFKKGRKNNIALLQLATANRAYLFRCNQIGLHESIVSILQNQAILKVGVAIRDDLKGLQKINNFTPGGFIDIQDFVNRFGIESNGLRGITGIVLKIKISKTQQLSNWEKNTLSDAQVLYAATDAWACHEIYQTLSSRDDD